MSAPKFDRGHRPSRRRPLGAARYRNGRGTPDSEATGCSRRVKSLEGMLTFNWIHFDEAQTDAAGESGYMQAEIDECYLQKHAQIYQSVNQRSVLRSKFNMFATVACRGLSLSR